MQALLDELKSIVGANGWVNDPVELEPHLTEWRGVYEGRTPLLVAPASTAEVAAVVKACAKAEFGIVPQGGNTGMCGGAVPDASGTQILLSLHRMKRVREVNPENFSITVEAGCILADIQSAARSVERYFPLSLGAEGTCQIGGNLATDAGGLNVLRYGTARSLTLGLEVVLADGSVLDSLRTLRKDTAGYDLKQLFIGSEGTLGIITAASLRLFPDPGELQTAMVAVSAPGDSVQLLASLKDRLNDRVETFELVSDFVFRLVEKHIPNARLPFDRRHPWYVLVEVAGQHRELEDALIAMLDSGLVRDAVVAKNTTEAGNIWRLRHSIAEAERQDGKALKHDIAVPVSAIPEFLARGDKLLEAVYPDARLVAFGHVGDGNLHYNVILPRTLSAAQWDTDGKRVTAAIYELVTEFGGSISAEHGIGQLKRDWLARYRPGPEFELMQKLKKTLDPSGILNPGKVI
ncbi:MAG: FAD-binding oxidoreductase [Woeseiaceae bacterium]|nr:FAD-binding oxidoreductase [Woeseiaceae bacterium]